MSIHSDKIQTSRNKTAIGNLAQEDKGKVGGTPFSDNRAAAIVQRKYQEMANNSPQIERLNGFQEMANNSPQIKRLNDFQEMANNSPQVRDGFQLINKQLVNNRSGSPIQRKLQEIADEGKTNQRTQFKINRSALSMPWSKSIQKKPFSLNNDVQNFSPNKPLNTNHSVIQRKLSKMTSTSDDLLKNKEEIASIKALIEALIQYEKVSEDDIKAYALELDKLYAPLSTAKNIVEDLVYDQERKELEPLFLKLLTEYRSELNEESKTTVHKLPLDVIQEFSQSDSLNEFGFISDFTKKLVDEEPAIKDTISVSTEKGGKIEKNIAYEPMKGLPFVGEPKIEDVKQGFLGDCWIIAPLISLLTSEGGTGKIKQMISPNDKPSDVYTVTLQEEDDGEFIEQKVDVLSRFPASNGEFVFALQGFKTPAADNPVALWPAIIEKAFAKLGKTYEALDNGKGASHTFKSLLGKPAGGTSIDKGKIIAAFKAKKPVTICTPTHYYAVVGVDDASVSLRNPHAKDEVYQWDQLESKGFVDYNTTGADIGMR